VQVQAAQAFVGRTLRGRYYLEEVLGAGGMGAVFRARHLLLERAVAVKLVEIPTEERRLRSLREARATARLKSEHAVRIFDADFTDDGMLFLVMELLHGTDLDRRVAALGPLPTKEAAGAVLQAGLALVEAHRNGIIHRDVKPANLFWTRTGAIKLLDFGVSKIVEAVDLTTSQVVLGSPLFMSPEQLATPREVGPLSDLWSLAVTLYFLLSAQYPYRGDTGAAVAANILRELPAQLPPRDGVPPALAAVVMRGLSKQPPERGATLSSWLLEVSEFSKEGRAAFKEHLDALEREPVEEPPPNQTLDLNPARSAGPATPAATPSRSTVAAPPPASRRWLGLGAGALLLAAFAATVLAWSRAPSGPPAVAPDPQVARVAPPSPTVEVTAVTSDGAPPDGGIKKASRPKAPALDPSNLQLK
jgi:serine/threonine-protein kinase